jgi:hypothetical protein
MPRYVIQEHKKKGQKTHWDLMLEFGPVLRTWRLEIEPTAILDAAEAVKIADHDLKFLEYEGPVNKGEGSVRIVDSGNFDVTDSVGDEYAIEFAGRILKGSFILKSQSDTDNWTLQRRPAP